MGDVTRQGFALLSFLVVGSIVALLVGHAAATGQLISASLGGFNTLLNTIENPGGGTASTGLGGTLSGIGNTLSGTAAGITNLSQGVSNLSGAIGGIAGSGGADYGGGSDSVPIGG